MPGSPCFVTTPAYNQSQGDLHHGASPVQALSSSQGFGYFGDTPESRELYSLGATMPQYFNMIQELPVDQGVYGDVPMYEDGTGSQDEAGETGAASSSRQASARRMMNGIGPERIALVNDASDAAMMDAKRCNWYPTEHVRYQTTMDFKEDILRNRNINVNEQTFADWAWPPSERNSQKMYQEGVVRWGTDAKFEPLGNLTSKFAESRVGVRQMTQFRLENMPEEEEEEEDSANASPSPSASSVSQAESSKPRRTGRDSSALTKSYARPAAGSMSERTAAGAADTKRQREKLTIEQKRRNHIRHEKKRRALIKDGFNDLTELIPELRGRTLSRSTILFKAADWLENLIQENEALVAQVSALENEKVASLAGTAEAPVQQSGSHKRATRRRA